MGLINNKTKYQFSKHELATLLHDYNKDLGALPKDIPKKVTIWDETLRDGEQTPGVFLTLEEKIKIARALDEIGTGKIAVGFPAISQGELDIVRAINHEGFKSTILGVARPIITDIDKCLQCDLDEIVLVMPMSDLHLKILHHTRESQIEMIQTAMDYTKDHKLRFNWVCEDGTRTNPDHLIRISQLAVDNQAESVILGDTVGILQPETTIYLINKLKQDIRWKHSHTQLGIHTHNDFGQAVANTLVAVYHGATLPHVCVNGYGERAGNAAFEEVVANLEGMGIKTGIKVEKLTELSKVVEKIFSLPLSAHKPIVGSNAFSHESGLHINALLAHPATYEPINPKLVGQKRRIYLGKFSGSSAIVNALRTKLKLSDIDLPREVIQKILQDVKTLQEESSKEEKHRYFLQAKELSEKLRPGITDTEFFRIANKHAKEYLKNTWVATDGDENEE
jgi:isopropylmalate/homocitrate/citramalate synthase